MPGHILWPLGGGKISESIIVNRQCAQVPFSRTKHDGKQSLHFFVPTEITTEKKIQMLKRAPLTARHSQNLNVDVAGSFLSTSTILVRRPFVPRHISAGSGCGGVLSSEL